MVTLPDVNLQPCLCYYSVDGSPEGSTLHFEQSFALKTTSGFARGVSKPGLLTDSTELHYERIGCFLELDLYRD